jgi:PTEN phosphatase family protein
MFLASKLHTPLIPLGRLLLTAATCHMILLTQVDCCVVLASIIIYCLVMFKSSDKRIKDVITVARVFRFLRLVKIIRQAAKFVTTSGSRYKKDGFNLDLSYITPQCVAMSLPAVGIEANYRNPIEEVARFFNTKHPDRYLIVNLCAERIYDASLFRGQVEVIPCDDHNPPMVRQLVSFVERTSFFMEEDQFNVVGVHCKSGKGRTGVLVSSWLLYSTFSDTAEQAMQWFVKQRLSKKARIENGITGASQRR